MLGEDHMKSRLHLSVLLIGCMWLTGLTTAAQQSLTAPGGATASGAVPNVIKYSSVLKDGSGAVITALSGVTFLIYRDQQGGAPLWMETQNLQPDKAGHYTVQLGAVSNGGLPAEVFMTGEARWLAVQLAGETEQPGVALVAVPYAMKAADAQTLGGLPASAFVLAAPPNASPATSDFVERDHHRRNGEHHSPVHHPDQYSELDSDADRQDRSERRRQAEPPGHRDSKLVQGVQFPARGFCGLGVQQWHFDVGAADLSVAGRAGEQR